MAEAPGSSSRNPAAKHQKFRTKYKTTKATPGIYTDKLRCACVDACALIASEEMTKEEVLDAENGYIMTRMKTPGFFKRTHQEAYPKQYFKRYFLDSPEEFMALIDNCVNLFKMGQEKEQVVAFALNIQIVVNVEADAQDARPSEAVKADYPHCYVAFKFEKVKRFRGTPAEIQFQKLSDSDGTYKCIYFSPWCPMDRHKNTPFNNKKVYYECLALNSVAAVIIYFVHEDNPEQNFHVSTFLESKAPKDSAACQFVKKLVAGRGISKAADKLRHEIMRQTRPEDQTVVFLLQRVFRANWAEMVGVCKTCKHAKKAKPAFLKLQLLQRFTNPQQATEADANKTWCQSCNEDTVNSKEEYILDYICAVFCASIQHKEPYRSLDQIMEAYPATVVVAKSILRLKMIIATWRDCEDPDVDSVTLVKVQGGDWHTMAIGDLSILTLPIEDHKTFSIRAMLYIRESA